MLTRSAAIWASMASYCDTRLANEHHQRRMAAQGTSSQSHSPRPTPLWSCTTVGFLVTCGRHAATAIVSAMRRYIQIRTSLNASRNPSLDCRVAKHVAYTIREKLFDDCKRPFLLAFRFLDVIGSVAVPPVILHPLVKST